MRNIHSDENGYNISLEAQDTAAAIAVAETEEDEDDQTDDINLEDICEVVISLKCKQCDFLCHDRVTLGMHIRQNHSTTLARKRKTCVAREVATNLETDQRNKIVNQKTASAQNESAASPKDKGKSDKPKESKKRKERNDDDRLELQQSSSSSSSSSPIRETEKQNGESSSNDTTLESALVDESVEDVFLCAECDIVFSSREMCCSHMHKVHGLKQFSADFIQEEIISKPAEISQNSKKGRKTKLPKQFALEAGTIVPKKYRVTKGVFHSCSRCPIKFENAEIMKFHEQCHQATSIKRELGDGYEDLLATDIVTQKGFLCPVCESNGVEPPQAFPKWGPCSWHLWKEHRIDCELYTCSVCKQFKSHLIARVKDHEQLHSTKASYKCKTCSKSFKQMKQLRCHEKYHKDNSTKLAPDADSRWYTPKECPICKRILSDSKCLKKHISAVHNKLKPYVCNICGHTSARKAELQLHVRQHTGEKPYKCPMCPFQTGDHNSLRKHKLRHSDERPYACSYCDYRCIQSCAFKKHILACHPGQEVVFLCQLCSHKSVNETLFAAHQKDHAEGRITMENLDESDSRSSERQCPSPSASQQNSAGEKYWSGDEDSLDIIDNGGVTIPASPPPDTPIVSLQINEKSAHSQYTSTEVKQVQSERSSQKVGMINTLLLNGGHGNKNGFKSTDDLIAPSAKPKTPNKANKEIAITKLGPTIKPDTNFRTPLHGFSVSISAPSPSLPSPRPIEKNSSSLSTNANEDTESSTSEFITNPHQLIQNIQLTPLDLTGIISGNEQSNDDGMLQRLLDMSGV